MKEFLSSNKIMFKYLDINENLLNLKLFLKVRDTAKEFTEIKEAGRIGLPCIVVNNGEQIIFSKENINIKELQKE